jgi:hypothetical protein
LPPGCEPICHGCRHRGRTLESSLAQKGEYLARVLAPWADRITAVRTVPPAQRLGYRDRVTLTARWDDTSGWRFGLVRRDELIVIHDCPVHTPRVNALVRLLVTALPPPARLPLAYLHVAGAQATLIVKARAIDLAALTAVIAGLPALGLDGLWVHCHPAAGRRMFARSGWTLAWGAGESRDAQGLQHGPTAFQQLLPALHGEATDLAEQHLRPSPRVAVLDLYCGIGASLRRWRAGALRRSVSNWPAAQWRPRRSMPKVRRYCAAPAVSDCPRCGTGGCSNSRSAWPTPTRHAPDWKRRWLGRWRRNCALRAWRTCPAVPVRLPATWHFSSEPDIGSMRSTRSTSSRSPTTSRRWRC